MRKSAVPKNATKALNLNSNVLYCNYFFFWVPVLLTIFGCSFSWPKSLYFISGGKLLCSKFFYYFVWTADICHISISGTCWSYSGGNGMHIASESSTREAGSLKAAQGVLLLSSSNRYNSVKQSSGLESENESYTWQQMVYFLVRIIGEQGNSIILCFSIFNQLWLHPVSTDINSYSQFEVGYVLVRKANICIAIGR